MGHLSGITPGNGIFQRLTGFSRIWICCFCNIEVGENGYLHYGFIKIVPVIFIGFVQENLGSIQYGSRTGRKIGQILGLQRISNGTAGPRGKCPYIPFNDTRGGCIISSRCINDIQISFVIVILNGHACCCCIADILIKQSVGYHTSRVYGSRICCFGNFDIRDTPDGGGFRISRQGHEGGSIKISCRNRIGKDSPVRQSVVNPDGYGNLLKSRFRNIRQRPDMVTRCRRRRGGNKSNLCRIGFSECYRIGCTFSGVVNKYGISEKLAGIYRIRIV